MTWQYAYTPYIWPMLTSAVFAAALGIYCWYRRSVPGALPLAILMLFAALWAVSAALQLAAVDAQTKIFWFKFIMAVCAMPCVIARLCFVVQYVGFGHWLTRRNLALLSIPILLQFILVLTNESHHLLWRDFTVDEDVIPLFGVATLFFTGFVYLLVLLGVGLCIWLFLRSPLQRWPVALILCAMVIANTAFMLDTTNINPFAPLDLTMLAANVSYALYAVALFGFRMFDPISAARQTVIQQMQEGMLVLDINRKIVDLNRAAERILGLSAFHVRGRGVAEILPAEASLQTEKAQADISLGTADASRHFELNLSALKGRKDQLVGYLVLLHDVTAQKLAQAQLLEQQKVVSALHEREQLARELHDSLGQALGYISIQAQAIRKRARDGNTDSLEGQLTQLAEVAQEAHKDIRESITSLKTGQVEGWSFFATLRGRLAGYQKHYGIRAELDIPEGLTEDLFETGATVQLLRVIQEALTNTRKHGRASRVQVSFACEGNQARIVIADDGRGFDPNQTTKGEGDHFGLAFMRQRMEQVGGSLAIETQPGVGTRVLLCVPIREMRKEAAE